MYNIASILYIFLQDVFIKRICVYMVLCACISKMYISQGIKWL